MCVFAHGVFVWGGGGWMCVYAHGVESRQQSGVVSPDEPLQSGGAWRRCVALSGKKPVSPRIMGLIGIMAIVTWSHRSFLSLFCVRNLLSKCGAEDLGKKNFPRTTTLCFVVR